MVITLTKENSNRTIKYDLSNDQARKKLIRVIHKLHKSENNDALDSICKQIENEAMIDFALYEIYCKAKNTTLNAMEFPTHYHEATDAEIQNPNNQYTLIKGKCYRLPIVKDADAVAYALITKYLYERQRHERNSEVCKTLRRAINKFIPNAWKMSDEVLDRRLMAYETASNTYVGDYISDDSDSEAEEAFKMLPKTKRKKIQKKARVHIKNANASKYQAAMNGKEKPPAIDFKRRPVIHHDTNFNRRQAKSDLALINEKLETEGALPTEFLNNLETKFVVAQYRGIHYITSKWDMLARRDHRKMDERNQPQYSSAVFASCGVGTYHEFLERLHSENDFRDLLNKKANIIATLLLLMQHSDPVIWKGYAFVSLFHLLQNWYSSNYDKLPKRLEANLQKKNSEFKPFLLNKERPLLSTADIPYHALKYAYGIKLYKEYKNERLRPRWRENGRAERPYSGKIYVSLHPLNDYTELNPSHITSMFKQGTANLSNFIAPERETSFLGFMTENRVVIQHIAKYPSFKGDYKTIFKSKYGISKSMYEKLKEGFQKFPPHSEKRRKLKHALGEYLCAYQEVRLIEEARLEAERRGAILIYRDEDGKFSLNHPSTPTTRNNRLHPIVTAKRNLYEALANNKTSHITTLSEQDFKIRLAKAWPGKKNAKLRKREWMRFYGNKKRSARANNVTPAKTLTK